MKINRKITTVSLVVATFAPMFANAAMCASTKDIKAIIDCGTSLIIGSIMPLLGATALMFFFWGIVKYIQNADNAPERAKGNQFMIWSVVAIFVMVSFMGLVSIISNSLDLGTTTPLLNNGTSGTGNVKNVYSL